MSSNNVCALCFIFEEMVDFRDRSVESNDFEAFVVLELHDDHVNDASVAVGYAAHHVEDEILTHDCEMRDGRQQWLLGRPRAWKQRQQRWCDLIAAPLSLLHSSGSPICRQEMAQGPTNPRGQ